MNNYNQLQNIIEGFKQNIGVLARVVNDHTKAIKHLESNQQVANVTQPVSVPQAIVSEDLINASVSEIKKQIVSEDRIREIVTEILNNMLNSAASVAPSADDISIIMPSDIIVPTEVGETSDVVEEVPKTAAKKGGRAKKTVVV